MRRRGTGSEKEWGGNEWDREWEGENREWGGKCIGEGGELITKVGSWFGTIALVPLVSILILEVVEPSCPLPSFATTNLHILRIAKYFAAYVAFPVSAKIHLHLIIILLLLRCSVSASFAIPRNSLRTNLWHKTSLCRFGKVYWR